MVRSLVRLALFVTAGAAGACASSGAVPHPFPVPGGAIATPADSTAPVAAAPSPSAIVAEALALRGVPYRSGGSDPAGFDCSGFVWYVFARQGIAVPRTVSAQFHAGRSVRTDELRAGDLVFFDTGQSPASHVGVLVAGDEFVHAPSSRGEVRVEHLSAPYWSKRFVGARRLE